MSNPFEIPVVFNPNTKILSADVNTDFAAIVAYLNSIGATPIVCATLNQLRLLPVSSNPVIVQGRNATGDGYEGIFLFTSANVSADLSYDSLNGILVPPPTDLTGASGAWKRIYYNYVDPIWMGAKGDSTLSATSGGFVFTVHTDNAPYIQAAINWALRPSLPADCEDIKFGRKGYYGTVAELLINQAYNMVFDTQDSLLVNLASSTCILRLKDTYGVTISGYFQGNSANNMIAPVIRENTGAHVRGYGTFGPVMGENKFIRYVANPYYFSMVTQYGTYDEDDQAIPNNASEGSWEDCQFNACSKAFISIGSFNNLQNKVINCTANNPSGATNFACIETRQQINSGNEYGGGNFVIVGGQYNSGTNSAGQITANNVFLRIRGRVFHKTSVTDVQLEDGCSLFDIDVSNSPVGDNFCMSFDYKGTFIKGGQKGQTLTVSTLTSSGTTATITTSSALPPVGTPVPVVITGATPTGYNGTWQGFVASATTITFTIPSALSAASGMTVIQYADLIRAKTSSNITLNLNFFSTEVGQGSQFTSISYLSNNINISWDGGVWSTGLVNAGTGITGSLDIQDTVTPFQTVTVPNNVALKTKNCNYSGGGPTIFNNLGIYNEQSLISGSIASGFISKNIPISVSNPGYSGSGQQTVLKFNIPAGVLQTLVDTAGTHYGRAVEFCIYGANSASNTFLTYLRQTSTSVAVQLIDESITVTSFRDWTVKGLITSFVFGGIDVITCNVDYYINTDSGTVVNIKNYNTFTGFNTAAAFEIDFDSTATGLSYNAYNFRT